MILAVLIRASRASEGERRATAPIILKRLISCQKKGDCNMGMLDGSIKAEVEKQLTAIKEEILEELKAMITEQEGDQKKEQEVDQKKPEENQSISDLFGSMQEQINKFNADLDGLKKELMQSESLQEEERTLEESYLKVLEGSGE